MMNMMIGNESDMDMDHIMNRFKCCAMSTFDDISDTFNCSLILFEIGKKGFFSSMARMFST